MEQQTVTQETNLESVEISNTLTPTPIVDINKHWQNLGIPKSEAYIEQITFHQLKQLYLDAMETIERLKLRLEVLGARELADDEGNLCLRVIRNIYINYYKSTENENLAALEASYTKLIKENRELTQRLKQLDEAYHQVSETLRQMRSDLNNPI